MNFKFLAPLIALVLIVAPLASCMRTVEAQETAPTFNMTAMFGQLSGMISEIVEAIDELFGLIVGADNLNLLIRNISAALSIWIAHAGQKLMETINIVMTILIPTIGIGAIIYLIPIPIVHLFGLVIGIVGIIVGLAIGIVYFGVGQTIAIVDSLAVLTSTHRGYSY